MRNQSRGILCLLGLCLIISGCNFTLLRDDLAQFEASSVNFEGTLKDDQQNTSGLVVVALRDMAGAQLAAFRVVAKPGPWQLTTASRQVYLFAFEDLNLDLRFQAGERFGWARAGAAISAGDQAQQDLLITIGAVGGPPPPKLLLNKSLIEHLSGERFFHFGTVTPLDNQLLSLQQAGKGLWQPYAFVEDGGTGIHFEEAYDPARTPVLFVHGVEGAPVNFEPLIASLDRRRFQAWYLSYPSGMSLATVSNGLFQFLEISHRKYKFDELHLVAHSVGGLVARGTVNLCVNSEACRYLQSLTTISTPWNGVESARHGVAWAPTVAPVWHDLSPGSPFLQALFQTPLPDDIPHHLLFGYDPGNSLGRESGDGVISLSSQLSEAAQSGATSLRGYHEGHVSILANQNVATRLHQLLK